MYTITFSIPTHGFQSITCHSDPMPQGELADFIRTLTEANYTILAVDVDHPEWYGMDEEELFEIAEMDDDDELIVTEE